MSAGLARIQLRAIALGTVLMFTLTTVSSESVWAAAGVEVLAAERPENRFGNLPAEWGVISEYQRAADKKTPFILHIQDAHSNPSAQKSIAKILEWVSGQSETGQPLIALEGVKDSLNPEYLNFFPGRPEVNQGLVKQLIQKGELTGAELFAWNKIALSTEHRAPGDEQPATVGKQEPQALFPLPQGTVPSEPSFIGVEEPALYRENLELYRDFLDHETEIKTALGVLRRQLYQRENNTLSKEARRYVREKRRRKEGDYQTRHSSPQWEAYLGYLKKELREKVKLDLEAPFEQIRFPNTVRLDVLLRAFKDLNPEQALEEKKALLKVLESKARRQKDKRVVAFFKELPPNQNLREHAEQLWLLAGSYREDPQAFAQFWKMTGRDVLRSELDAAGLYQEMGRLEGWLEETLSSESEEAKKTFELGHAFDLLERTLSLELTAAQAVTLSLFSQTAAANEPSRFEAVFSLTSQDKIKTNLRGWVQKAVRFYEAAEKRDEILLDNTLKAARDSQTAVLISGGFHTEGFKARMRERGVGYAVIQPKLTVNGEDLYRKVLREENEDLSAYFETSSMNRQEALFFKTIVENGASELWEKEKLPHQEIAAEVAEALRVHPVLKDLLETRAVPEGSQGSRLEIRRAEHRRFDLAGAGSQETQTVVAALVTNGKASFADLAPSRPDERGLTYRSVVSYQPAGTAVLVRPKTLHRSREEKSFEAQSGPMRQNAQARSETRLLEEGLAALQRLKDRELRLAEAAELAEAMSLEKAVELYREAVSRYGRGPGLSGRYEGRDPISLIQDEGAWTDIFNNLINVFHLLRFIEDGDDIGDEGWADVLEGIPQTLALKTLRDAFFSGRSKDITAIYERLSAAGLEAARVETHRYTVAADEEKIRVLAEIKSSAAKGFADYGARFLAGVKNSGTFLDIGLPPEAEWRAAEKKRIADEKYDFSPQRVFHDGLLKDEQGAYWIVKKLNLNAREAWVEARETKNYPERERLAFLLARGRANLTEIRLVDKNQAEQAGLTGEPSHYYLSRVVTPSNYKKSELPHRDWAKAYAGLFVANILMRKFDPHPFNVGHVGSIPVALDHDGSLMFEDYSNEDQTEKKSAVGKFATSFLMHAVVKTMLHFRPADPRGLVLYDMLDLNETLRQDYAYGWLVIENMATGLGLGQGYIEAEGLTYENIRQSILDFKNLENIRELAEQAGYKGDALEAVTRFIEENQRRLGQDVDFVWQQLTGRSAGFQNLDMTQDPADGRAGEADARSEMRQQGRVLAALRLALAAGASEALSSEKLISIQRNWKGVFDFPWAYFHNFQDLMDAAVQAGWAVPAEGEDGHFAVLKDAIPREELLQADDARDAADVFGHVDPLRIFNGFYQGRETEGRLLFSYEGEKLLSDFLLLSPENPAYERTRRALVLSGSLFAYARIRALYDLLPEGRKKEDLLQPIETIPFRGIELPVEGGNYSNVNRRTWSGRYSLERFEAEAARFHKTFPDETFQVGDFAVSDGRTALDLARRAEGKKIRITASDYRTGLFFHNNVAFDQSGTILQIKDRLENKLYNRESLKEREREAVEGIYRRVVTTGQMNSEAIKTVSLIHPEVERYAREHADVLEIRRDDIFNPREDRRYHYIRVMGLLMPGDWSYFSDEKTAEALASLGRRLEEGGALEIGMSGGETDQYAFYRRVGDRMAVESMRGFFDFPETLRNIVLRSEVRAETANLSDLKHSTSALEWLRTLNAYQPVDAQDKINVTLQIARGIQMQVPLLRSVLSDPALQESAYRYLAAWAHNLSVIYGTSYVAAGVEGEPELVDAGKIRDLLMQGGLSNIRDSLIKGSKNPLGIKNYANAGKQVEVKSLEELTPSDKEKKPVSLDIQLLTKVPGVYLGVDVGGGSAKMTVIHNGQLLHLPDELRTISTLAYEGENVVFETPEAYVKRMSERMVAILDYLFKHYGIEKLDGVGINTPGAADFASNRMETLGQIPIKKKWNQAQTQQAGRDLPLKIAEILKLPAGHVRIRNDMDGVLPGVASVLAAAKPEFWQRTGGHFAFDWMGTGHGFQFAMGGVPMNAPTEASHMIDDFKAGDSKVFDTEAYTSIPSMLRWARQMAQGQKIDWPEITGDALKPLADAVFYVGQDETALKKKAIAQKVFERFAQKYAANLALRYYIVRASGQGSESEVLLGGGVARGQTGEFLRRLTLNALAEYGLDSKINITVITDDEIREAGVDPDDVGPIGAAYFIQSVLAGQTRSEVRSPGSSPENDGGLAGDEAARKIFDSLQTKSPKDVWKMIKRELETHDPNLDRKKEGYLPRLYHALKRNLYEIQKHQDAGLIHPGIPLDMFMYRDNPAQAAPRQLDRPLRIGFLPVAGNPINWGHILIALVAMNRLKLDQVVFRIQGEINYKNVPESDKVSAADRHALGEDVLSDFAPLLSYTDVGLRDDHEGMEGMFEFSRALNQDKNIQFFYILGSETEKRTVSYMDKLYEQWQRFPEFDQAPNRSLEYVLMQRGEFGRQLMQKKAGELMRNAAQKAGAETVFPVHVLRGRDVDLNIASTFYREGGDDGTVPRKVHEFGVKHQRWGNVVDARGRLRPRTDVFKEHLLPTERKIFEAMLDRMRAKPGTDLMGVFAFDGPSGAGKSTVAEELDRAILREGGGLAAFSGVRGAGEYTSKVLDIDLFLKARPKRQQIERFVAGEEKDPDGKILPKTYLEEHTFFRAGAIKKLFREIQEFRLSGRPEQEFVIKNPYIRRPATDTSPLPEEYRFTLKRNTILLVVGKYVLDYQIPGFYDASFRIKDEPGRNIALFQKRVRFLNPKDEIRQIIFYERALQPSYEAYAQRTDAYVTYDVDLTREMFELRPHEVTQTLKSTPDQILKDTRFLYEYNVSGLPEKSRRRRGSLSLDEAVHKARRQWDTAALMALLRLRALNPKTVHGNLLINQDRGDGMILLGLPNRGKSLTSSMIHGREGWILGSDDAFQVFFVEDQIIAGLDAGIPLSSRDLRTRDPSPPRGDPAYFGGVDEEVDYLPVLHEGQPVVGVEKFVKARNVFFLWPNSPIRGLPQSPLGEIDFFLSTSGDERFKQFPMKVFQWEAQPGFTRVDFSRVIADRMMAIAGLRPSADSENPPVRLIELPARSEAARSEVRGDEINKAAALPEGLRRILADKQYALIKPFETGGSSAETLLVGMPDGRPAVLKYADWEGIGGNGIPWLRSQAARLRAFRAELPAAQGALFPEVYDFSENPGEAYYVMEFFPGAAPITEYFFEAPDSKTVLDELKKVLRHMTRLYAVAQEPAPENYILETHLKRLEYRVGLLAKHEGPVYERLLKGREVTVGGRQYADAADMFETLLGKETVRINGRLYPNLPRLMELLQKNIAELDQRLSPRAIPKYVHGDILLRNILRTPDGGLKLIDLRGTDIHAKTPSRIGIAYELGKMTHSLLFELIRNDRFALAVDPEEEVPFFDLQLAEGQGIQNYLEARRAFEDLVKENKHLVNLIQDGSDWEAHMALAEAVHFATDAVNRFSQDATGQHALAYYSIAVVQLAEFLQSQGMLENFGLEEDFLTVLSSRAAVTRSEVRGGTENGGADFRAKRREQLQKAADHEDAAIAAFEALVKARKKPLDLNDALEFFGAFLSSIADGYKSADESDAQAAAEQGMRAYLALLEYRETGKDVVAPFKKSDQPVFEGFPPGRSELIVVTRDRPGLTAAVTGAMQSNIVRDWTFFPAADAQQRAMVMVFEISREDKELGFGALSKILEDVRAALSRTASLAEEKILEGRQTNAQGVYHGRAAVLQGFGYGVSEVVYDVYAPLNEAELAPAEREKRKLKLAREDVQRFYHVMEERVLPLIETLPETLGLEPSQVEKVLEFVKSIEEEVIRQEDTYRQYAGVTQYRRSALSRFLKLVQLRGPSSGLPRSAIKEIDRVVLQALKDRFFIYDPSQMMGQGQLDLIDQQKDRLRSAAEQVLTELEKTAESSAQAVYEVVRLMLPQVEAEIQKNSMLAEEALTGLAIKSIRKLQRSAWDKDRANAADFQDVFTRIILALRGGTHLRGEVMGAEDGSDIILFARNVSRKDIADRLEEFRGRIQMIVTDDADVTKDSHWVQMADNDFGVPTLMLPPGTLEKVLKSDIVGEEVSVDAGEKKVFIRPGPETKERLRGETDLFKAIDQAAIETRSQLAQTAGGIVVDVRASAESPEQIETAMEQGAAGVGLGRTEYLIDVETPEFKAWLAQPAAETREELIKYFSVRFRDMLESVTIRNSRAPTTLRTYDFERDKDLKLPNPDKQYGPAFYATPVGRELLKIELLGMLEAGLDHSQSLRIMFPAFRNPMDLKDFLDRQNLDSLTAEEQALLDEQARDDIDLMNQVLDEAFDEMDERKPGARRQLGHVRTGFMIETLEGIHNLEHILERADFISVGTTDMTISLFRQHDQISRDDPAHAAKFSELQPEFLKALQTILNKVSEWNTRHGTDISVDLCGGLAAVDAVLLGLIQVKPENVKVGISRSPRLAALTKQWIRQVSRGAENQAEAVRLTKEIEEKLKKLPEVTAALEQIRMERAAVSQETDTAEEKGDLSLSPKTRGERELAVSAQALPEGHRAERKVYQLGPKGFHVAPVPSIIKALAAYPDVQVLIVLDGMELSVRDPFSMMALGLPPGASVELKLTGPEQEITPVFEILETLRDVTTVEFDAEKNMIPGTGSLIFEKAEVLAPTPEQTENIAVLPEGPSAAEFKEMLLAEGVKVYRESPENGKDVFTLERTEGSYQFVRQAPTHIEVWTVDSAGARQLAQNIPANDAEYGTVSLFLDELAAARSEVRFQESGLSALQSILQKNTKTAAAEQAALNFVRERRLGRSELSAETHALAERMGQVYASPEVIAERLRLPVLEIYGRLIRRFVENAGESEEQRARVMAVMTRHLGETARALEGTAEANYQYLDLVEDSELTEDTAYALALLSMVRPRGDQVRLYVLGEETSVREKIAFVSESYEKILLKFGAPGRANLQMVNVAGWDSVTIQKDMLVFAAGKNGKLQAAILAARADFLAEIQAIKNTRRMNRAQVGPQGLLAAPALLAAQSLDERTYDILQMKDELERLGLGELLSERFARMMAEIKLLAASA